MNKNVASIAIRITYVRVLVHTVYCMQGIFNIHAKYAFNRYDVYAITFIRFLIQKVRYWYRCGFV
jgi:hypothetical protein